MSISTNIDGTVGGGANQLLDLLALVSNPAVYEAKVNSLQAAIAENQKYVEAVAPTSEILDLREKVKADKVASTTALAEAKAKANELVKVAQEKADAIISESTAQATITITEAQVVQDEVKVSLAEAKKATAEAKKAKADYDKSSSELQAQVDAAVKAKAEADGAKQSYDDLKASLIAKHTAFIQGL
jgi:hypothetical protein